MLSMFPSSPLKLSLFTGKPLTQSTAGGAVRLQKAGEKVATNRACECHYPPTAYWEAPRASASDVLCVLSPCGGARLLQRTSKGSVENAPQKLRDRKTISSMGHQLQCLSSVARRERNEKPPWPLKNSQRKDDPRGAYRMCYNLGAASRNPTVV